MAVRFEEITDGLSSTIFVGEKHVPLGRFGVGGLDSSVYNGACPLAYTRSGGKGVGLAQSLTDPAWKFGSYHRAVCQFVFGDGGVRGLPLGISPDVLGLLLDRSDGEVIPDY